MSQTRICAGEDEPLFLIKSSLLAGTEFEITGGGISCTVMDLSLVSHIILGCFALSCLGFRFVSSGFVLFSRFWLYVCFQYYNLCPTIPPPIP